MYNYSKQLSSSTILFIIAIYMIYLTQWPVEATNHQSLKPEPKLESFFSSLKQTIQQRISLAKKLSLPFSLPLTKILLSGGAILSLLFIFMRMLIVIGPILLLGAMTRESTDATDLLKILIEFYNQVVVALDNQNSN